jgi:hypothetical protein
MNFPWSVIGDLLQEGLFTYNSDEPGLLVHRCRSLACTFEDIPDDLVFNRGWFERPDAVAALDDGGSNVHGISLPAERKNGFFAGYQGGHFRTRTAINPAARARRAAPIPKPGMGVGARVVGTVAGVVSRVVGKGVGRVVSETVDDVVRGVVVAMVVAAVVGVMSGFVL